jgi:plasmid maintenance system antidote protein VapI
MSIEPNSSTGSDRWALSRKWIDRRAWQSPTLRKALAEHDLATVFRVLRRYGVSQRKLAAITDQSQSEISEIVGGRRVRSYDVLARIAEGFGIPRGWMGLAYDQEQDMEPEMPGPQRCRCGCCCGEPGDCA